MVNSPFPRLQEPLIEKNSFREAAYAYEPIMGFIEAKPLLPVPILPERPEWVEMYWRAWELAWLHLKRPQSESNLVANFIGTGLHPHIFMWDSAFMVLFGQYGRRAFDFVGTLNNFYTKQHDDGFICREIVMETGADFFLPFDPNGTGPNILAWTEWRYFRATGDDSRLAQVFWPLMGLHRWYRQHRTWQTGLYWATGFSSGMNNQPRVPDSSLHHRHWAWSDATFQAILNAYSLRQMAVALGELKLVPELANERSALIQRVNEEMWNDRDQFYQDVDKNGRFSRVKSIGAYWGLLDRDLIPAKRLDPFIQHLRDPWSFNLPHRIPSQSADSDGYNANSGNRWRGGVWPSTNYMVLKGLRDHNYDVLAHDIALNHLETVWQVYQRTDTFWDHYAPETANYGDPAIADYVGWSGLTPISILLEDVIGFSTDWPLRQVRWDRRLKNAGEYGVHNYPLGQGGTADIVGDETKVTVKTDVNFTLTIIDVDQTIKAPIATGETEIDLT
ncbi:MAG: trehalase family glycosidase [Chloroflexota bacterium]